MIYTVLVFLAPLKFQEENQLFSQTHDTPTTQPRQNRETMPRLCMKSESQPVFKHLDHEHPFLGL